ncbi:gamma-glutamyltransferase [Marinobacter caseinilyticus]|uniref:gamma-glutamyltransferase n=1 Tax=Marinobacter caseinilyticus TaxID=2692195 RepID=UPI0014099CF8|nr:gamma-glutamyltransferase [Marinobacter caseinilyticus]
MKRRWLTITVCVTALSWQWAGAKGLPQAQTTQREMVVTANPLATAAGAKILKMGGSAADAMVAVQTVLGLVEPQSTGIGGGAFIVYFDSETGTTMTLDAREKAPAAATEGLFLDPDGNPLGFVTAWQSGLSVGVPGVPRMMEHMHRKYGRLPWPLLFVPGIVQSLKGFTLTRRTSDQVTGLLALNPSCEDRLTFRDPVAFNYFVDSEGTTCSAKPAGTKIVNRDYAQTLKLLAIQGTDAFYTGAMANDIASAVQNDLNIPGTMSPSDLAHYEVIEREPVCFVYRENNVCGMGPPSSGGLAVGQILGLMAHFDLSDKQPLDEDVVHWFSQAMRLAFADRNKYVADSDFVSVPSAGMLNKDYLTERAALIGPNDSGSVAPGVPPGKFDPYGPDFTAKTSGTSHVAIVDRYGNALSMTTTIESSFGNGVMVPGRGFLLNNELTDFSFIPTTPSGDPVANRVQANKRPRSSMSPAIVFDDRDRVALVTGSPGGSRIIGYTAQSIMNVLDFGLDPQQAINVPHYQNRNTTTTDLEIPIPNVTLDYDVDGLTTALENRGHIITLIEQTSGLSLIRVTGGQLIGGADQRRDGTIGGR